jgi:hypothetical protein
MRGQPAVRIALTLALGVALASPSLTADAAGGRSRGRAPVAEPASSADATLAWGRRYLDLEGWTLQANSSQAIVFVRAMRPARADAFWVRFERRYPTSIGNFVYRSILQRVSVNCRSGEFRTEETYYFRDNDRGGPSRHDRGEGAWETPLPDSLMEAAVQWQCRGPEAMGQASTPQVEDRDDGNWNTMPDRDDGRDRTPAPETSGRDAQPDNNSSADK